jgi:tRNA threonylcarbamoyladenosine biosynthesis protein TsaE
MQWKSNSPEETKELGKAIFEQFPDTKMICLNGELGSGKTQLTKGIAESLGLNQKAIKSPTFTTILEHHGEKTLIHCDFYRIEKAQEIDREWWEEIIDGPQKIIVAEWANRIQPYLPEKRLEIEIIQTGENERTFIIKEYS